MIDSGSVASLITNTLANRILLTTPSAKRITTKQNNVLKTFSNEPIKVLGQLETMVIYNDSTWRTSSEETSPTVLASQLSNNKQKVMKKQFRKVIIDRRTMGGHGIVFWQRNREMIYAANILAHKEQSKMKADKSRFMWLEGIARPIPRSKRSVQVNIARKIHASQRQKKNLDGLYEVLVPGSPFGKVSPTTSIIKEPNRPEVWVRNADIAKIGTRNERDTELGQYIERRPKKIHEKTLEQENVSHWNDLNREKLGSKKIKRNKWQPVISSGRSFRNKRQPVISIIEMI